MYWPSPVRSRCSSAKPIAIAADIPVDTSPIAIVTIAGGRSASPIPSVVRACGLADPCGYRGVGLSHVVVADLVGERAALPERGDRAHDDLWIALAQFVVPETHLLDDSGRVVF